MRLFRNEEIERMVLGMLSALALPDDEKLRNAIDRLTPDCFTSIERQRLYGFMMNDHIHNLSISEADLASRIIDLEWLDEIRHETYSFASLDGWVEELNHLRIDRALQEMLIATLQRLENEPSRECRREIINNLPDVLTRINQDMLHSSSYLMNPQDAMNELEAQEAMGMQFVSTGIRDLDSLLGGGFLSGSLVVIGAPPSGGKTHLSLKILLEMQKLQPQNQALIFTLEGKRTSTWTRLISHFMKKLYKNMSEPEKHVGRMWARTSNIFISEKGAVTADQIRSACKNASVKGQISVVMVDYLDRVGKPKGSDRTDEKLASIANELADIATTYNCIVILTTQLSKEAIKRDDKRPKAYDSKNSNGAAEAAWYWFGIKRIAQWDEPGKRFADSNLVELILDKAREGEQGIVWFNTRDSLYFDIDQKQAEILVSNGNHDRKLQHGHAKTQKWDDVIKQFTGEKE